MCKMVSSNQVINTHSNEIQQLQQPFCNFIDLDYPIFVFHFIYEVFMLKWLVLTATVNDLS
jgi:hypothetical protein